MQISFLIKIKLTNLWYDNFGENQTPLQRNAMAAIPKIMLRGWGEGLSRNSMSCTAIGRRK